MPLYYWKSDGLWHNQREQQEKPPVSAWSPGPISSRSEIIAAFDRTGRTLATVSSPPPAPPAPMDYAKQITATTDNNGIHSLYVDFGAGAVKVALTLVHVQRIVDTFIGNASLALLQKELEKRGYQYQPKPALPGRAHGPKSRILTSPDSWWRIVQYESTAIDKSAFNPRTRELYIVFKGKPHESPRIHRYVEVTDTDAQYLERATSAGSVYNDRIKGKYPSISATSFPSGTGIKAV